jgi:hypothetical protein
MEIRKREMFWCSSEKVKKKIVEIKKEKVYYATVIL